MCPPSTASILVITVYICLGERVTIRYELWLGTISGICRVAQNSSTQIALHLNGPQLLILSGPLTKSQTTGLHTTVLREAHIPIHPRRKYFGVRYLSVCITDGLCVRQVSMTPSYTQITAHRIVQRV